MERKQKQTEIPDTRIPEITEVNRPEIGETTFHPASPTESPEVEIELPRQS